MCSLKESMRGVCRHCPTKTEAPAPPLDLNTTKENNQLSEKTFKRGERRLWERHSQGVRIDIQGRET